MRQDLAFFQAADLYEYACPAGAQDPRSAGNEALVARAEERVADYQRNTSERSAAERLCSRAREVFGDDAERRRYDEYLQWCDLRAVFDGLDARLGPEASACSAGDVAGEISRLNGLLGSRPQAEALMESFLANRGIVYLPGDGAARDDKRADAERFADELVGKRAVAPVAVLPDSALLPSTPDPREARASQTARVPQQQPAAAHPYRQQPVFDFPVQAQGNVGAVRRCPSCGTMNPAEMRFCCKCGAPMDAVAGYAPQGRPAVSPVAPHQKPRRKFPVAAIAIIVAVAIAIAGAAAYVALNGVPDLPFLGSSSAQEDQSSSSSQGVKRVPSNSVDAIACSSKTVIVPLDADGQPLRKYKVELQRRGSGDGVETTLSISGTGGFTIADFNDPDGKAADDVPNGSYKVVMSDTESKAVCTVTVEYRANGSSETTTLEVTAAP